MSYFTIGHRLPSFISCPLFGDSPQHGLVIQEDDPCWKEWENTYLDFYTESQKQSIGKVVNDFGYRVLNKINLTGKRVLEIGPGELSHLRFWKGNPELYVVADVRQEMLTLTATKLEDRGVDYATVKLNRDDELSADLFACSHFDLILSFYTIEHIYEVLRKVVYMGECG